MGGGGGEGDSILKGSINEGAGSLGCHSFGHSESSCCVVMAATDASGDDVLCWGEDMVVELV